MFAQQNDGKRIKKTNVKDSPSIESCIAEKASPLRRIPTQARSKAKYDAIIATAKELIGERGNDAVSMREIAKQAEVPISSIYQYFPDKNAILEAIMQDHFDLIRTFIKGFVDSCHSQQDLKNGIEAGIDLFYSSFKKDPALASLWAGLQANSELKALDAEDSHINAEIITHRIMAMSSKHSHDDIYQAALLLLHTSGMTVRLALDMPDENAKKFLNEFIQLALLRLNDLM